MSVIYELEQPDVLRFDFDAQWTWEDLILSVDDAIRNGNAAGRNDIIVNLTNANFLPPGALGNLRTISRRAPTNGGVIVLVGMQSLTAMVVSALARMSVEGRKWRVVPTLEEARQLIHTLRAAEQRGDRLA